MGIDMKQLRRQARLGAGLRELTNQGFDRINSDEVRDAGDSRVSLRERVEHYARHSRAGKCKLYPEMKNNLTDSDVTGYASQIDSGLTLLEIAKSSDGLVKPLLFYYGLAQVCLAASDCFLNWRGVSPSHGMRVDYDQSVLKLKGSGTFQKLATTLFVLNRDANPFIPFVFPHDNLTTVTVVDSPTNLRFDELLGLRGDSERLRAWIHDFGVLPSSKDENRCVGITRLLLNYCVVFYSSCLCRYQPAEWKNILDGRRSMEILEIEAAYEAADRIADGIVNFVRCPAAGFLAQSSS